jgi:hypothetical protein
MIGRKRYMARAIKNPDTSAVSAGRLRTWRTSIRGSDGRRLRRPTGQHKAQGDLDDPPLECPIGQPAHDMLRLRMANVEATVTFWGFMLRLDTTTKGWGS